MQPTAQDLADLLRGRTFTYADEDDLQQGIAQLLTTAGLDPHREFRLSDRDRVDVLVGITGGRRLAIEVKLAGTAGDVRRQLSRYATHDQVDELMLVTTRRHHLTGLGSHLGGKPLTRVLLRGSL